MTFLSNAKRTRKRSAPKSLPLFEHAEAERIRQLPLCARRLARRWGLPAAVARNIAELAGYPGERDR